MREDSERDRVSRTENGPKIMNPLRPIKIIKPVNILSSHLTKPHHAVQGI